MFFRRRSPDIVIFKRLSRTAIVPVYATPGSAGMDLHADENLVLKPGEWKLIATNIAVELPDHLEGQIRSRSGLAAKHNVKVANGVGTIDPDYRGPLGVVLENGGINDFRVERGDRIAQFVIAPFVRPRVVVTEAELATTRRGAGGFGSTGIRVNNAPIAAFESEKDRREHAYGPSFLPVGVLPW